MISVYINSPSWGMGIPLFYSWNENSGNLLQHVHQLNTRRIINHIPHWNAAFCECSCFCTHAHLHISFLYKQVFNHLKDNKYTGFIMAQEWACHILNGLTNHHLPFYLWSWMDSTLIEVLKLSWSREFCFSQVRDPLIQNLLPCCACSGNPCSPCFWLAQSHSAALPCMLFWFRE